MTRQEAITEACEITALVYHSIGKYRHAADGFCDKCPAARRERDFPGAPPSVLYRNEGRVFAYIRKAVLAQLKKDGYAVAEGFDTRTGRCKG